jgi:hypothetical protein
VTINTTGAQQIPVNLVGSSTFGRYNKISSEKTYNMFISTAEGENPEAWLVNFPGYKRVYQLLPAGEGRGIFRSIRGDFILVVVNSAVYRIDIVLGPILIGNLASDIGEVFIDENLNNQICIVDGINAYIYNHSLPPNLTVQVLGVGLIPNYVTYHNTFFLFGNGDRAGNGAAWFAYSFATLTTIAITLPNLALQTKPDYAIAVVRIPGQSANVLVFGTAVCEVHTQIGGLQNYRRVNTISVDYGCLSVETIDSADQYIVWLAVNESNGPVIMVYSGQGAQPLSSDGIDYVMGTIRFPEQSTAMFTRVDGHLFYQLTFYNALDNLTLVFDFNTKKFFHLSDEHLNYHPARDYAYLNQKIYMLSLNNCSLYEFSSDITVIDENIPPTPISLGYDPLLVFDMQRIRICENIQQKDSDKFIVNYLAVTIEQGNDPRVSTLSLGGINNIITESFFTPPETDIITEWGDDVVDENSWFGADHYTLPYQPRVDLTISQDSGITWSATVGRGLNPIGFRKNILNWNKLGACNCITLKFRFWGMDRFVVNNGVMEIY